MNKWLAGLSKLEGAVRETTDPFASVLRTPSPSVNFIFGRTHGLPRGYSMLLWGPPGGGKSLLTNALIGQMHSDDPESIAIKFDTEFRSSGQLGADTAESFGVDTERLLTYEVNRPDQIFDRIEMEIGPLVEKGAPIQLIVIDSINGVQGLRETESDSINKLSVGDHAQTIQKGLKRILPVIRRNKIALVVISQQRSELDQWEVKRGNKTKAAVSHATQHHCEYFVYVEKNNTAAGRKNEMEEEFVDESHKDVTDAGDITGHKVRVWMQKSSFGGAGRSGEFTIDYRRGIINIHEEVFRLGCRWGIIDRPDNKTYVIGGQRITGKANCLAYLEKSPAMQKQIVARLIELDKNQKLKNTDTDVATEVVTEVK